MNTSLKPFRSFAERNVKTENPLSVFAVERVMNKERTKSFIEPQPVSYQPVGNLLWIRP